MNSIPVHKLQDKTNQGFLLKRFIKHDIDYERSAHSGPHRDDHYMFFIMQQGLGMALVDFEEKIVNACQLYYIQPEQIHYRIKTIDAKGWFLAVDAALIPPACRNAFESWLGFQQPVTLTANELTDYDKLLGIIYGRVTDEREAVNLTVIYALLRSFFEMAATTVNVSPNFDANSSRPAELAMNFKKLLSENIRKFKSPADYARMLHVSESYLNESLKKITGSPVSFRIKYKMITEAKRLLYFSDWNVKQIASYLGFENHSYFSRFFNKETGTTALGFRKKFKSPASFIDG